MVRRSLLFTLTSQASGTWTYSTVRPEGRTSEAAKEAVAAKTARADGGKVRDLLSLDLDGL